jgi:hypothetical protein
VFKLEIFNHMSTEQNAMQWIDSQVQRQIGKGRKSTNITRSRRKSDRFEGPLNVIGCLALVHAVRSAGSGDRARVAARRTTTA